MTQLLEQGDRVDLGEKYKDDVHGLTGVATAQCSYLTGCDHILLEFMKDGEVKSQWVDILRLARFGGRAKKKTKTSRRRTGGPAPHPPSRGPQ